MSDSQVELLKDLGIGTALLDSKEKINSKEVWFMHKDIINKVKDIDRNSVVGSYLKEILAITRWLEQKFAQLNPKLSDIRG